MGLLEGKRAIVVGASGGIGMACVREFLQEGAMVLGTYRRENTVLDDLAESEEHLQIAPLNLSSVEEAAAGIKAAVATLGGLDILVNAAGIARPALLHAAQPDQWREVIESSLMGAFYITQSAILPLMRSGGGSIVEISSVYGKRGGIGQSSYCAAKAGVLGLTRAAAVELAAKKIRVNAIAPGFIETSMTEGFSEKLKKQALEHIPMKRFGKPEEVAHLAAFLASSKAAYITGQVYSIDGGLSAW